MSDKTDLKKWAELLNDETLLKETYNAIYDSLGSLTERMYNLGYEFRDIQEQEELDKYYCLKSDVLYQECCHRGLKLFE